MRRVSFALVAVLAGLVVGAFGGGWLARTQTPAVEVPRGDPSDAHEVDPGRPRDPVLRARPPSDAGGSEVTNSREDASRPLGGPAFAREVRIRAETIRTHARQAVESAELIAGTQLRRERAEAEVRRSDAERGGTHALLRRLAKEWEPPWETVADTDLFATWFARKHDGGLVDGRTISRDTKLQNGDVIRYGPGAHWLNTRWLDNHQPFPQDLVIEGYGMDDTLLRLGKELGMGRGVHVLTFRDLTVHCSESSFESMRSEPYTLRLERCRVVGFDRGAGGSGMLEGSIGAFYATDCRFEAGYGTSPGSGRLFAVGRALVARIENSTIRGPFRSVTQRHRTALVYVGCRFEDMVPGLRSTFEKPPDGVRFEDCTFAYLPDRADAYSDQRPITDLNPAWGR